jgi:hypothetical protein
MTPELSLDPGGLAAMLQGLPPWPLEPTGRNSIFYQDEMRIEAGFEARSREGSLMREKPPRESGRLSFFTLSIRWFKSRKMLLFRFFLDQRTVRRSELFVETNG